MADTSFADGDLFIGLGSRPGSAASKKAPPPPPPKGKKRKGEQIGNVKKKRAKHQQHPKPLPATKGNAKATPSNKKAKGKKDKHSKRPHDSFRDLDKTTVLKGSPWAEDVDWERCRDPAEMLNDEVTAFYNFITPTEAEYSVRKHIIELITGHVKKWKPEMEVVAFGSWQTQLYLPEGDLDLVVVPPPNRPYSNRDTSNFLTNLSVVLRNSGIADKIALVLGAKVPIMKFVTRTPYGRIPVDISFNQTNGIDAGKIITHYLDALPGARELITVVKYFLAQRQMNEVFTGGLGSYSVICLVISFMQMHPKLRRSEMDAQRNLGTLLLEFFELYGRQFNYELVGISIRRGGEYFLKRERGWVKRGGNPAPFTLAIEDPQNLDNDISSGSYGIPRVKLTLAGAYDMIRQRMFDRAALILARDQAARPKPRSPEDYSILSCVLGVEDNTIAFRHHLEELHSRGNLAADLESFERRNKLRVRLENPPLPPVMRGRWGGPGSSSDMEMDSGASHSAHGDTEDGEIHDVRGAGAIVVDDNDVSDGASSHTDDSSGSEAEDAAEAGFSAVNGRERSVSEDVDLYPSDKDAAETDSRYAAAGAKRRKGKGKEPLSAVEVVDSSESEDEAVRSGVPAKHQTAASAGPSRTTSPPLRVLGAAVRSAPGSPNGRRPDKWVRPAERARYWAAKSAGELIDLTNDSD
ncbi:hypothetical protein CC85DRAFT_277448 [Cutaneotrichosporon oleaginosum]|uniref:polynucleotide adenylyltransferase n=1 Tax=Cutaneotrichosporon oleaginosum TaxID=879819 RepID=A0A0J0XHR6_9TREE|nr:uncharacterized protein CC85DRAFT_277448 [Cutaneotrichosporon oleaginosum]KLT40665.1 hypothetical protein CC85DRAFT_277448 [Cutaneotrichosporon oleaginosum]TXT12475.1 hypothetical protein COLE_02885 [Cutaneotrichosporon oleaginosum]